MSGKGTKTGRMVEKKLATLGYQFDRVNSSARHVYVRDGYPDVPVSLSISEREARHLIKGLDRLHGVEQSCHKRNAAAVKERQAADRERAKAELERLRIEHDDAARRYAALPVGDLSGLVRDERLAIEHEVERIAQERRRWERLMTEIQSPLNNSATHTAGARI